MPVPLKPLSQSCPALKKQTYTTCCLPQVEQRVAGFLWRIHDSRSVSMWRYFTYKWAPHSFFYLLHSGTQCGKVRSKNGTLNGIKKKKKLWELTSISDINRKPMSDFGCFFIICSHLVIAQILNTKKCTENHRSHLGKHFRQKERNSHLCFWLISLVPKS